MASKYRFKDRAAAEEAYVLAEQREMSMYWLVQAMYEGKITWGKQYGHYKFGIFHLASPSGAKIVRVFNPNPSGQRPTFHVYTEFDIPDLEREYHKYDDEEYLNLRDGIAEIKEMLRMLQKKTA